MKKTIIIIFIVLGVLLGALLALPIFFKKNVMEVAKNTLNKQVNAKIEFADLKISLFRNFPSATVVFHDFVISGKQPFENDTLLYAPSISTTMDLVSLFSKSGIQINEIVLQNTHLNLLINENGKANWDIVSKASEGSDASSEESAEGFKLHLEKIEIANASVYYNDDEGKMKMQLSGIDFDVSGSMHGNATELQTQGKVNEFSIQQNKVQYVSKTALEVRTLLDVDFNKMKFTITENELMVNRLPLELSGVVEIPNDTTRINIQINTKASDFDNFLALVPPVYADYLKDVKTKGSATINGNIEGYYFNEDYPGFEIKAEIAEGNLHYIDMPEEIKNIRANVLIAKTQGELDLTKIEVKEAHAAIRDNPVDLTLTIENPVSDPMFTGALSGKVNLSHLKDALPIDSVNMAGIIDANFVLEGRYSALEEEAYDKLKSDGEVVLDGFVYESAELTKPISVPSGRLDFSPKNINLKGFYMQIGQSDFRLTGVVSNYLNYFLKDGVLKGNLQLNSRRVNLNELLRLQVRDDAVKGTEAKVKTANVVPDSTQVLVFDVPENIDITFRSTIENAVIDRLPIQNIKGSIRAVNEKLELSNLSMNTLDGELKVNGSYKNTPQNQPYFDFGIDVLSFDIPMMYQTLSGIQKIMPAAGNSTGNLSSSIKLKGRLSPQMKLIPSTANGNGLFSTQNLEIKDSPIFNQLSGVLKKEKLRNVDIDDFKANFTVEDGSLLLKPFSTKVIGQETKVSGSLNAESLLDMRLDFNVERDLFGSDIQKFLGVIPGNEKIKMLPAGVLIKGPVGGPKVSLDLSETQKAVTDATKDDLKNTLNELGKGLKKLFR